MKKYKKFIYKSFLMLIFLFTLTSCNKDNSSSLITKIYYNNNELIVEDTNNQVKKIGPKQSIISISFIDGELIVRNKLSGFINYGPIIKQINDDDKKVRYNIEDTNLIWSYLGDDNWETLIDLTLLENQLGMLIEEESLYNAYLSYFPEYNKTFDKWINDIINGNLNKLELHTIYFDSDNGDLSTNKQIVKRGDFGYPAEPPIKEDYIFKGWYINGVEWSFDFPILEDTYLVAKWEADFYHISLNLNGGIFNSKSNFNGEYDDNGNPFYKYYINKRQALHIPYKKGHIFLGWSKNQSFNNSDITEYVVDPSIREDVTYYAHFKANEFTIYFNVNLVNVDLDINPQTILYNSKLNLPVLEREDEMFLGWNIDPSGKREYLTNDDLYYFDHDVTLFAQWKKVIFHEVTYDYNYDNKVEYIYVEDGNKTFKPEEPIREGYYFIGWIFNNNHIFNFDNEINESITLIAFWEKIMYHEVIYDYNYDNIYNIENIIDGEKIIKPEDPVRENYIFLGWMIEEHFYDFNEEVHKSITLIAKWKEHEIFEVIFNLNYGDFDIYKQDNVEETYKVFKPADPIRVGHLFLGWYKDDILYDFDNAIYNDLILYALWEEADDINIEFNRRIDGYLNVIVNKPIYSDLELPKLLANIEKPGYKFGGWFKTKKGSYWNEPDAISFPFNVSEDIVLYAYWEPINSSLIDYDEDVTFSSGLKTYESLILNPFDYTTSHEEELIKMMTTPLYDIEINWKKAIDKGLADFPGDFSKFENKQYSIDLLDYDYILIGGSKFPVNEYNEDGIFDGKIDHDLLKSVKGFVWTYEIKEGLIFEDGTPINAETFNFSLKYWLKPNQFNFQVDVWSNEYPIRNGEEYYLGYKNWEDVGLYLDSNNPYKFTIELTKEITLQDSLEMINKLYLVNPDKYLNSYNEDYGHYQYGLINHPFSSYGPYVIKDWNKEKIVLNKNYDYVGKHLINFKSQEFIFVQSDLDLYDLFKDGKTSLLNLNKDTYNEFRNNNLIKESLKTHSNYLIINLSDSKTPNGNVHHDIMHDKRFRQALFHGLNRKEISYNVAAPQSPSLMPLSNSSKHYYNNLEYYSESEQHRNLIENELGWNLDEYGYNPTKARLLFNEAYNDWISLGNDGPITLKYITSEATRNETLDNYLKLIYETLFQDENGNKRLIIEINVLSHSNFFTSLSEHDFDLSLTNISYESTTDIWWKYLAITLFPAEIGASVYGLNYPFIGSSDNYDLADYVTKIIEVDFYNTYQYLNSLVGDLPEGYEIFLNMLDQNGLYRGTVLELANYILNLEDGLFNRGIEEPFIGANNDLNNMIAAFERIYLDYVTVVPIGTPLDSTIYKENVIIEWSMYSDKFGWGDACYRYLNTDSDFN